MRLWTIGRGAVLCLAIGVSGVAAVSAAEAGDGQFPYKLRKLDLAVIPAAYGIGVLGERLENRQTLMTPSEVLALDGQSINPFDRPAIHRWSTRWDNASDLLVQVQMYVPCFLIAGEVRHKRWSSVGTFAVMYYEAYLLTEGLTKVTKYSVGRNRPYLYNTQLAEETRFEMAQDRGAYGSFISGHTSGSFCAAVFFAKMYQDTHPGSRASKWVWGTSLAVAAVSGYARYEAGWHYPTDVIGGAVVGSVIGYLVPTLHKSPSDTFRIGPDGHGGLSVTVRF